MSFSNHIVGQTVLISFRIDVGLSSSQERLRRLCHSLLAPRVCELLAESPYQLKCVLINQNSGGFATGWNYLFNYWFLCPTQVCTWRSNLVAYLGPVSPPPIPDSSASHGSRNSYIYESDGLNKVHAPRVRVYCWLGPVLGFLPSCLLVTSFLR